MIGRLRPGSIRGRLMAALVLVVIVAGGVLAVGMVVMLRAERDFRVLARDRIPAVALAGELAEATGELAALAMQMVADPAMPAARMRQAIGNASAGVEAVLASPVLLAAPERASTRAGIETAEHELRDALTGFGRVSADLTRHAQDEARAGTDLRWIHADVQDQVQGILSDLSFNMDTQLAALVVNTDPDTRAVAEQALSQDWLLRDRMQQIGSEAATLTALLLQARSADSPEALEQTAALGRDTLDRLALAQLNLPQRVDITLLAQALERLKALASGADSVFLRQQQRLELHRAAVTQLHHAQTALAGMQSQLTDLGRTERIGAQRRADAAATAILRGSVWLGLVTLLGAVATAVILAVFVHNRILLRIEALLERITRTIGHLRRIARRSAHRNTRVALHEPVQAALELLDHRLRAEGVAVECADLTGLAAAGDEILLEQVLLNILGNALDAIPVFGKPRRISWPWARHSPISRPGSCGSASAFWPRRGRFSLSATAHGWAVCGWCLRAAKGCPGKPLAMANWSGWI